MGGTPTQHASRLADMHHSRTLRVARQNNGDVIIMIEQDGMVIGGIDMGDERQESASVEFCTSPVRSMHTLQALYALIEAIKRDNEEKPLAPQT